MSITIPTPQQQLKFLKNIQQILHSGSFSSTYKFALLMSLSRLAIEQGKDTGESLKLDYLDIAEKFIDLYWKQTLPFHFNENEPFLLQQNNGKRDFLASEEFLLHWQERNQNFDCLITDELSKMGFLTDIERSHSVANWAYGQAKENGYVLWNLKIVV